MLNTLWYLDTKQQNMMLLRVARRLFVHKNCKETGPCTGPGRTPGNHPEQRFPMWARNPMTGPGPGMRKADCEDRTNASESQKGTVH